MRTHHLAEHSHRLATTKPQRILPALLSVVLISVGTVTFAEDDRPFAEAKLFFQLNDTDQDLGIHAIVDGEPWRRLKIFDPRERRILDINLMGRLRQQGLTELRFESAEPNFEDLAPAEFFERFPPGEYEIEGRPLAGREMESTVEISHVLPAPPEDLQVGGMAAPEDCDEGPVPEVTSSSPVIISWAHVTASHPEVGEPGPINIVRYELAVEREEPTNLVLTADLPPTVTEFSVPAALLNPDDEIKFQVLATDEGGNETSSESCFVVVE